MTDKKTEALKLALEALDEIHLGNMTPMAEGNWNKAITAIRAALAEPDRPCQTCVSLARAVMMDQAGYDTAQPQHEPVAWMYDTTLPDGEVFTDWVSIENPSAVTLPDEGVHNIRPLYAAPQPIKPWVGLTEEEWLQWWQITTVLDNTEAEIDFADFLLIARAIEAKLKEKNK